MSPDLQEGMVPGGKAVYTVSQLTREVKLFLEETFDRVWVEGELSNFTVSAAGHAYFSLKDSGSLLNCVMFRSQMIKVGFEPEEGMKVLCGGRLSLYEKRGQYQLYAESFEPRGKGALQQAYEQLKKKLLKEGLFREENKKDIPVLPSRIGVITSSTGAAIRDILNVARRRYPGIEITIYPVQVQGEKARTEIAEAISAFNEYNSILRDKGEPLVEVLIVGRGGGSLEDLWAFNEEEVARAIYASKIPVISAVGHEVDHTIADFVADMRAPTPSAAAELALPRKEDLQEKVLALRARIEQAEEEWLRRADLNLSGLEERFGRRSPEKVLEQKDQELDDIFCRVTRAVEHVVELGQESLAGRVGRLNALSPLAVLERGYSITFKSGKALRSCRELQKGDIIESRLAGGKIISTVEKAEQEKHERKDL